DEYKGEVRYRLLETIRRYAWEKLLADDGRIRKWVGSRDNGSLSSIVHRPSSELRLRHRDWFLSLSERAEDILLSREQGEWLDRIEIEHDNLRLALAWCRDDPSSVE